VVALAVVSGNGDFVTDVFDDAAGPGRSVPLATIEKRDRIALEQMVCGALYRHVDLSRSWR